MKDRIIIAVGKDWDGFTFRLRPKEKRLLEGFKPRTKSLLQSKDDEPPLSQVSISFEEKQGFEALHGPIYKYIAEMLTGMTLEHLDMIGGVVFAEADTGKVIYDTKGAE